MSYLETVRLQSYQCFQPWKFLPNPNTIKTLQRGASENYCEDCVKVFLFIEAILVFGIC